MAVAVVAFEVAFEVASVASSTLAGGGGLSLLAVQVVFCSDSILLILTLVYCRDAIGYDRIRYDRVVMN